MIRTIVAIVALVLYGCAVHQARPTTGPVDHQLHMPQAVAQCAAQPQLDWCRP